MKLRQSLARSAFIGPTALLAIAFQQTQPSDPPLCEQFPGPLADADFGAVVAGEFTGDLQLDAIVMDGLEPKLAVAPEVLDTGISTGLSASAIAVLPGVLAGKDLLLVADQDGLHSLERDSAEGDWIDTLIFDDTTDWADAVALAVGDLDGEDGLDVVGVNATGDEVLVAYGAGDGTFDEGTPLSFAGPPIHSMVLLNWRETGDTAGTDEIAVASNAGLAVMEPAGTVLWTSLSSVSNARMTVIRDAGASVERLAVVGVSNGNDFLRLHGVGGSTTSQNLGAIGVVSMSSGDVDGDGDTELFLSLTSEKRFWMLVNESPSTPTFVPASAVKVAYGPTDRDPSWNHAGLAVADFDHDGVIDVLAPSQGGTLPLGGGNQTIPSTLRLQHVGTPDLDAKRIGISQVWLNTSTHRIQFVLNAAATPIDDLGGNLWMKVTVWHSPDFGSATETTAMRTMYHVLPDPTDSYSLLNVPEWDPETSPDVYTFVFRQVSRLGGAEVALGPAQTALVVSLANRAVLETAADTEFFVPMQYTPDTTNVFGGAGGGPTVPPGDPEAEPEEGEGQEGGEAGG